MVQKAYRTESMAALGVFPSLNSSRILSNMSTLLSTAMPIANMPWQYPAS
jgi:hypothetical protein